MKNITDLKALVSEAAKLIEERGAFGYSVSGIRRDQIIVRYLRSVGMPNYIDELLLENGCLWSDYVAERKRIRNRYK